MGYLYFLVKPMLASFAACFLMAIVLLSGAALWQNWQPASCMPFGCFCEALYEGAIKQPMNTWSGFFFVLVGFGVLGRALQDRSVSSRAPANNLMKNSLLYPGLYAIALVITGLGTSFYHATLTLVGQFFDVLGMYLVATFILLYNVSRLSATQHITFSETKLALVYLVVNTGLGVFLIVYPEPRRLIFAALLIAAISLETRIYRQSPIILQRRYLFAALSLLALGFLVWIIDNTKVLCAPTSWLQGHALWQLMGAAAAGLLYLYYRSENSQAERIAKNI